MDITRFYSNKFRKTIMNDKMDLNNVNNINVKKIENNQRINMKRNELK